MTEMWMAAMSQSTHSDPLISGLPIRVQKEGHRAWIGDSEMNYVKISAVQSLPSRIGVGMSVAEFYDSAEDIGKQMGEQQAKHLLEKMSEPSATAQKINFSEESTFDDLLTLWEKMEIKFTNGLPDWPTISGSQLVLDLVKDLIEGARKDPVSQTKWRLLIEKKRKEFDETEARRRLVD